MYFAQSLQLLHHHQTRVRATNLVWQKLLLVTDFQAANFVCVSYLYYYRDGASVF